MSGGLASPVFLRAFSLADEGSYGDAVLRGVAGVGLFGPARRMAQLRDLAARFARGLLSNFPYPPMRGRRECRVRAAPAVSCAKVCKKGAHEHTGSAEASDIPCAMALRLISRSPRRAGLVVTVISGIASTNLTPASGRQDHTTSPYASVPFVKGTSASTASHPALVTIAKRPSYRDGTKSIYC